MNVSVCMATYNGEKYIIEQLKSILNQLRNFDEVIISDDNSTDGTVRLIQSLNDSRIKIFANEFEKGYAGNFECALLKASGDIIYLADQDDVWVENKIKKTMPLFATYDFIVSDAMIVDEYLSIKYFSHIKLNNTKKGFIENFMKPRYIGACMAFKKEVVQHCFPFPKNRRLAAHDYWICLVAELNFKTCILNEPLIKYRRHSNNASIGGGLSNNSITHKLKVRAYVALMLLLNFFNNL